MAADRPALTDPLYLDIPPLSPTNTEGSCDLLLPVLSLPGTRSPSPIPDDWTGNGAVNCLMSQSFMIPILNPPNLLTVSYPPTLPATPISDPNMGNFTGTNGIQDVPLPTSLPVPLPPSNLEMLTMAMLNGLAESFNMPLVFPPVMNVSLDSNPPTFNQPMYEAPSESEKNFEMPAKKPNRKSSRIRPKKATTPFKCNHCKSAFVSEKNLHTHHCKTYTAAHICLLCNTVLPENVFPKDHLRKDHDIDRPLACGCCSWVFSTQSDVIKHRDWLMGKFKLAPDAIIINNCKPGTFAKKVDKNAQANLSMWQAKHQERFLRSSLPPSIAPKVNRTSSKDSLNVSNLSLMNVFNGGASIFDSPSSSTSASTHSNILSSDQQLGVPQIRGNRTGYLVKNALN